MIYQQWYFVVYILSAAIVAGYYILSNNCIKSTLADGFQEESFPLFCGCFHHLLCRCFDYHFCSVCEYNRSDIVDDWV